MLVDMHLTIFMGLTLQVRGYGKADKEVSVGQLQESVVEPWLTKGALETSGPSWRPFGSMSIAHFGICVDHFWIVSGS